MEASANEVIRVVESELTNVIFVEFTPPDGGQPITFRVVPSVRTLDWFVRNPHGATVCRATTRERGVEAARGLAMQMLEQAPDKERAI